MSFALEVIELWKSYAVGVRGCSARVRVLRGVSFSVAHGERVGIVGPRGAGKTTLLHCIAGLRQLDAGRVRGPEPAAGTVVLLDEWMPTPSSSRPVRPAATVAFAREVAALDGRVDRVLVLRDGRITPFDARLDVPVLARRVAERRGRVRERGAVVR